MSKRAKPKHIWIGRYLHEFILFKLKNGWSKRTFKIHPETNMQRNQEKPGHVNRVGEAYLYEHLSINISFKQHGLGK